MKPKIFIDSDILLDVLIAREPHAIKSAEVINLCELNKVKGYTSSNAILNIAYVLGKSKLANVKKQIKLISELIEVLPTTNKDIEWALESEFKDFEDAVQNSVAARKGLSVLVTRNVKDYKVSKLSVHTPKSFLSEY